MTDDYTDPEVEEVEQTDTPADADDLPDWTHDMYYVELNAKMATMRLEDDSMADMINTAIAQLRTDTNQHVYENKATLRRFELGRENDDPAGTLLPSAIDETPADIVAERGGTAYVADDAELHAPCSVCDGRRRSRTGHYSDEVVVSSDHGVTETKQRHTGVETARCTSCGNYVVIENERVVPLEETETSD